MAACPDSWLGVEMPERPVASEFEKDVLKGFVLFASTSLAVLAKQPAFGRATSAFLITVVGGWLVRNLPGPTPAHVEWIQVRELMAVD